MSKILKERTVAHKIFYRPVRWSDISDIAFQDDYLICINKVEAFTTENESWNDRWQVLITQFQEETDEEYEERRKAQRKVIEKIEAGEYQYYLKLKAKFEPNET